MAQLEPAPENSNEARRHAEGLVRAFIQSDRQARLLALIATPKGRHKLGSALAPLRLLDAAIARPLPGSLSDPKKIIGILRAAGAPGTCYVISESREMDGKFLPLEKVIDNVVGGGVGTLVSCIPGELGFFEGEGPSDRYILRRSQR